MARSRGGIESGRGDYRDARLQAGGQTGAHFGGPKAEAVGSGGACALAEKSVWREALQQRQIIGGIAGEPGVQVSDLSRYELLAETPVRGKRKRGGSSCGCQRRGCRCLLAGRN